RCSRRDASRTLPCRRRGCASRATWASPSPRSPVCSRASTRWRAGTAGRSARSRTRATATCTPRSRRATPPKSTAQRRSGSTTSRASRSSSAARSRASTASDPSSTTSCRGSSTRRRSRRSARSSARSTRAGSSRPAAPSDRSGHARIGGMSDTVPGGSQTLSRGIRILELLASSDRALTIDEIARALDVHRSVAYRLLRTLEHHDLAGRDDAGRVRLASGLAALAYGVSRDLQQAAYPELVAVADEVGMTCLIAVLLDGAEAVTLLSASPRNGIGVSYRPGHRHPITRGAPGKAILMALPEAPWPADLPDDLRAELETSIDRGWAESADEVVRSLSAVAVPLDLPGQAPASLAVIHVSLPQEASALAERLRVAAGRITASAGR